jgi:hypothetical protein
MLSALSPVQHGSRRADASCMTLEEVQSFVASHGREALATWPDKNDVQVAQNMMSKWAPVRHGKPDRDEAVLQIADELRRVRQRSN